MTAPPPFVVCIPARNEARRIPRALAAIAAQSGLGDVRPAVVVLVNASVDATAAEARRAAAAHGLAATVLEPAMAAPSAGRARRAAMERGAAMLGPGGVLLTTDADAEPEPDWIARSLDALAAGADAVGAALRGDPAEEAAFPPELRRAARLVADAEALARALEDRIDPVPGDPAPRHGDHTGGGLALTRDAYLAAGGCPPVPSREDQRLVQALRRAGGVVRHCPRCRVTVSARMHGRAAGGMAEAIRGWAAAARRGATPLLPDPRLLETAWRRRAALRAAAEAAFEDLPPEIRRRRVAAVVARACPPPAPAPSVPADLAAAMLAERLAETENRHDAA